ncbi:cytochrome-c oxidase subunit VIIa [Amanita rubescens]|nr:cytochrome-c oxidase subunit VIIa [Amanita rubescens]
MPIAPITGKLRKQFWLDVGLAFSLGISSGYAYWYGSHLKSLERQESYYVNLEKQRVAAST